MQVVDHLHLGNEIREVENVTIFSLTLNFNYRDNTTVHNGNNYDNSLHNPYTERLQVATRTV